MIWRGTLARRLAVLINGGFALIWVLAVVASALVLRSEQEEMLDLELRQTAGILQPVMANAYRQGLIDADVAALIKGNGRLTGELVFALVDPRGVALLISPGAGPTDLPDGPPVEGYARTAAYAVYTTPPDQDGLSLRFGDALEERREAYLDSFLAFIVPMLAILPLGYLLVGWIARSALRPLGALASEIARRGDARLDPIDGSRQPDELRAITATLNGFMIRLSQALEGERTFATSAAHELRSPVAVALAQVQRLHLEVTDPAALDRIARLEAALKRMQGLVARLLQLARAEAGIGPSQEPQDVSYLLVLVLAEVAPDATRRARLQVERPNHPVMSSIDPDAFAIVVSNLLDNALQHAPADSPVTVTLTDEGILTVANDGETIGPADLARLTERFHSRDPAKNGFGLGLYISDRIARQSGGDLLLRSPSSNRTSGLEAVLRLPLPQPRGPVRKTRLETAQAAG
jgi:two-component system OmpR family sensor kinase